MVWLLIIATLWGGLYLAAKNLHRLPTPAYIHHHAAFISEVVGATGLLALATVGFFWQVLLTPNTWMPAGGGDLAPFLYPNYRFAAENLRQGIIPLWNPHLYSGTPFAADIQSGLFYPINLIVFLLVPTLTYQWLEYLAIFHFWLAGATMYLCLRLLVPVKKQIKPDFGISTSLEAHITQSLHLHPERSRRVASDSLETHEGFLLEPDKSSSGVADKEQPPKAEPTPLGQPIAPLAAFAGALAFQFSDLFIVHFGNLNMIAVAAWLPLVFLLFHLSLIRSSLGLAAASGVILAISTLAGHIQITLFIMLTLGFYTLYHLSPWLYNVIQRFHAAPRPTPHAPRPTFPILALIITISISIGLSALLLIPAYEMSQHTPRAELTYDDAARYSLHPAQLIGLAVPNYFGRDPALHWGPWSRVETGYIGLITLMLALIGTFLDKSWLKHYFLTLGIISLLLALGGYSILHGWLYATAPGFNQLRAPARFILLLDFSLAALAAFGLNKLLQPLTQPAKATLDTLLKLLSWSLGGLIIIALPLSYYAMLVTQDRNPVIFNRATGAAAGVATFAIFAVAGLIVLHLIKNKRLPQTGVGVAIIALIGLDLFTLGHNVDVGHNNPTAGFDHPEALAFLQSDPGHFRLEVTTDVWHAWQPDTALLNGLNDAWGLYNPLTLADTTLYWSSAPPRSSSRYNFLGIKYIIASKAGAPADGNIIPVFDGDPNINIYLNQNTKAPVQFVGQSLVVDSHKAAWEAIHAEPFEAASMVVLEGGQTLNNQPISNLAFWRYDLHNVTVAVETDQPGYLVLPDAYYPGWQATVDGQPETIQKANYAFRAVYVPAGEHVVQFIFNPILWKVGLGISGLFGLVLLGWAVWCWKIRPRML